MREFFRGWKRKLGVVTLMMACFVMCGWAHGMTDLALMTFPTGQHSWQEWTSGKGSIRVWMFNTKKMLEEERPASFSFGLVTISEIPRRNGRPQIWRWWCDNFGSDDWPHFQNNFRSDANIPYWSIVIPLTAVAAWLILSKPRPPVAEVPA